MYFDEILTNDDLLDALWDMHFDECTPIQELAMPEILDGRDLIGIAQTGTGKTAAYLLPVIERLVAGDYDRNAINCVVMAPTRELAQQIDRQLEGFSYYLPVSSVPIYGGTDGVTFERQRQGLKQGADIIIATPGRLLAHISMGYVDLSKLSFLVLDEADRMLDMGFYDDIMQIVKEMNKDRQTLMFSATMPPKIRQLAASILNDPAEVKLSVSKPADKIDQRAYICYETQKLPLLKYIINTQDFERIIVFASSKLKVKELTRAIRDTMKHNKNVNVAEMHSDLDQEVRDNTLLDFKSGKVNVLIATDIVARGIDIDDISIVLNYDVPHDPEDYVHRIGRTARAGAGGIGATFVSDKDQRKFGFIEKFLEKEVPKAEIPAALGETPAYNPGRGGNGAKDGGRRNGRGSKKGGKPRDKKRSEKKSKPQQNAHQPQAASEGQEGVNNQEGAKKKRDRKRRYYRRKRSGTGNGAESNNGAGSGEAQN